MCGRAARGSDVDIQVVIPRPPGRSGVPPSVYGFDRDRPLAGAYRLDPLHPSWPYGGRRSSWRIVDEARCTMKERLSGKRAKENLFADQAALEAASVSGRRGYPASRPRGFGDFGEAGKPVPRTHPRRRRPPWLTALPGDSFLTRGLKYLTRLPWRFATRATTPQKRQTSAALRGGPMAQACRMFRSAMPSLARRLERE